jgi:hypothetical protein
MYKVGYTYAIGYYIILRINYIIPTLNIWAECRNGLTVLRHYGFMELRHKVSTVLRHYDVTVFRYYGS